MAMSNPPSTRQAGANAPAVDQETLDLARSLGQREEILAKVAAGEFHPAMIAYGLWRDDDDLDAIMQEVIAQRWELPRW